MKTIHVNLEFITPLLGTTSANPDIQREYIASKAGDGLKMQEEIDAYGIAEMQDKAMTIFPKMDPDGEDFTPFVWDYQIKGYLKEAAKALSRMKNEEMAKHTAKIKAYIKVIEDNIFIYPRRIPLDLHGMELTERQRPLRGQTAQGERIALANSEEAPEGSTLEFEIVCPDDRVEWVQELLAYGEYKGMGQWRNAGNGRFMVRADVE